MGRADQARSSSSSLGESPADASTLSIRWTILPSALLLNLLAQLEVALDEPAAGVRQHVRPAFEHWENEVNRFLDRGERLLAAPQIAQAV